MFYLLITLITLTTLCMTQVTGHQDGSLALSQYTSINPNNPNSPPIQQQIFNILSVIPAAHSAAVTTLKILRPRGHQEPSPLSPSVSPSVCSGSPEDKKQTPLESLSSSPIPSSTQSELETKEMRVLAGMGTEYHRFELTHNPFHCLLYNSLSLSDIYIYIYRYSLTCCAFFSNPSCVMMSYHVSRQGFIRRTAL